MHDDLDKVDGQPSGSAAGDNASTISSAQPSRSESFSDRPIRTKTEDRFGYSKSVVPRLLRISLKWPQRDGLVVGLYGEWGIGKSSVLNLFEELVSRDEVCDAAVRIVRFSPWNYDNAAALIASFFATISDALSKPESGPSLAQVARALKRAGQFLAVASQGLTLFGVHVDVEKISEAANAASGAGDLLLNRGESALQELWNEVEEGLLSLALDGGRIVVLIDDADRLNRVETLRLLRLLRRIGDLPGVSVVVAMDETRVRKILESDGEAAPGEEYLEKIVQVGIPIPLPTDDVVEAELTRRIKEVLDDCGLAMPKALVRSSDWSILQPTPYQLLTRIIQTPREIVRLANALRILLLGSKDVDLNALDAVLLETLHVFFPATYLKVRDNRRFFTGEDISMSDFARAESDVRAEREEYFESLLPEDRPEPVSRRRTREAARQLVLELLGNRFLEARARDADQADATNRRLRHPDYFDRYFLNPPREGELSRREIDALVADLDKAGSGSVTTVAQRLESVLSKLPPHGVEAAIRDLGFGLRDVNEANVEALVRSFFESTSESACKVRVRLAYLAIRSRTPIGFQPGFDFAGSERFRTRILVMAVEELDLTTGAELLTAVRQDLGDADRPFVEAGKQWIGGFANWLESTVDPYDECGKDRLNDLFRFANRHIPDWGNPKVERKDLYSLFLATVQRRPARLPMLLEILAIAEGDSVRLTGAMRGPEQTYAEIERFLGGPNELRGFIRRFRAVDSSTEHDPLGLVTELERLAEKFNK